MPLTLVAGRRWAVAILLLLGTAAGLMKWLAIGGHSSAPLQRITEPITFTSVSFFDDGGSEVLWIKDARGLVFPVCLMNSLDYHEELLPGHNAPVHNEAELMRFTPGGDGDRAFLLLLERWSQYDPDAKPLEQQYIKLANGQVDADAYWKDASSTRLLPKIIAVGILRKLRDRCRKH